MSWWAWVAGILRVAFSKNSSVNGGISEYKPTSDVAVTIELADRIKALSVEQVEALCEALLDFHGVEYLVAWLGED
jgi:hypothetical protein